MGKSSLVLRFVNHDFKHKMSSTIGASFMSKLVTVDGEPIKFQIWDTAGQETYRSLAPMYYRGAAAALLVYDITSEKSFSRLQEWVAELENNGPPGIALAIAGNKADLEGSRRVSEDMAREYAERIGAAFLETSAKADSNVREVFEGLARRLPPPPAHASAGLLLHGESQGGGSACC